MKKIAIFQRVFSLLILIPLLLAFGACTTDDSSAKKAAQVKAEGPLTVATTTGIIADLVKNIGGEFVTVQSLMGPGVDPHLYRAAPHDLEILRGADIIFYNGLFLEGKINEILERFSREKPCFAVSRDIPREKLRAPPEFAGHYDPHIWFDVQLWQQAASLVYKELKERLPAASHERLTAQYTRYQEQLTQLDKTVREQIAQIPKEQRVLVTAHDAFGYFGRAYDIEVLGLQGISTAGEFGLYDLTKISDLVIARKVRAVFVESSVPERFIRSLIEGVAAQGHEVKLGGTLYSDALGTPESSAGDYIGMVTTNVHTIVSALK